MGVAEFEAAVRLMESRPDKMRFAGPRQPALVAKAEEALGLHFPPSYKQFLLRLGAGSFGGTEVYGVIHDHFEKSGVPDGIWYTLRKRTQGVLPRDLVLVHSIEEGGFFCLDTSTVASDGECPVLAYYPAFPREAQSKTPVAPDFGTLFQQLITEELTLQ